MRVDMHGDEQVAGRRSPLARRSLARDAQRRAIAHPGRHADGDRAGLRGDAVATTLRARVVDDLAGAAAIAAWLTEGEAALVPHRHAAAAAGRATTRRRARSCTVAMAGLARRRSGETQWQRLAAHRLFEAKTNLGLHVAT